MLRDTVLIGKIAFYEHGFIFIDNRLGAFVVPYLGLSEVVFHLNNDEIWMEVKVN